MKQGIAMGGRALSVYLIGLIVSALVGMGLSDDWYALQVVLNVALLAGMAMLMYMDGCARGERACTLTATAKRVEAEGRTLDENTRAGCYQPKAVLPMWIIAALPLLLIACVNLITEPMYPPVLIDDTAFEQSAPAPDDAQAPAPDVAQTPAPDVTQPPAPQADSASLVNWPNVVARAAFITLIAAFRLFRQNPHGLNLLFLFFALIYPLPEALGYLSGPRMRRKKLHAIETGKKRKMRNLRVGKKARAPRSPKVEV